MSIELIKICRAIWKPILPWTRLLSASMALFTILHAPSISGQHFVESGTDSNGWIDIPISETFEEKNPLLAFFNFDYSTTDRHIRQVIVFPPRDFVPSVPSAVNNPADGTIIFRDDGDPFLSYTVDWRLMDRIEENHFSSISGSCPGGSCSATVPIDPANGVFVLSGFTLSFNNGDHHINEIGVIEDQGVITVSFSDKNGDDPFNWRVHYMYLPQNAVATTGTAARSTESFGGTASITSGDVVISGFHFDFSQGDRHIKRISVDVRNGGSAKVFYMDKSPSSSETYSWIVNWAELE